MAKSYERRATVNKAEQGLQDLRSTKSLNKRDGIAMQMSVYDKTRTDRLQ